MKRRDFIRGLSAACLGTALVRDSLELEPSNAQLETLTGEDIRGYRCEWNQPLCLDEFASVPRCIYEDVVAGFVAS